MRCLRSISAASMALCVLAFTGTGLAQSADERARSHFQAGSSYFDTGDYPLALREFQRAYDLSRRPELFYNLSLVHERLGNVEEATEYLRRYLNETSEVPDRETLEIRLQNFERRLEQGRTTEESAGGSTDGSGAATADEAKADVEGAPPPADPDTGVGDPAQGLGSGGTAGGVVDGEPDGSGRAVPLGSVVSFGVAGAGLLMFAGLGTAVLVQDGDLEAGCLDTGTCDEGDLDRQDTLAMLADIGLGIAVAGAAVGVILLFTGDQAEEERAVAWSPWVLREGGGASARVRF